MSADNELRTTNYKLILVSLLFFLMCASAISQTANIFGVIRDSLNKPLFGASVSVFGKPIGITTDDGGKYSLSVPANVSLKIVFSYTGLKGDTLVVTLKENETREINNTMKGKVTTLGEAKVEAKSFKVNNITRLNPKDVLVIPTPNQTVEDIIKTLPGVHSSNELSSTYSVRGGNYDENLVYINDVEVYRPFLVRSGQQEGLSIINPDMVESISFSAGGFDAVYGDKLSSVLDIKYRKPKKFAGSVGGSLLGGSLELEGISKNKKWTYMTGIRQKSNQYLLNTFQTTGDYKPSFTDAQLLVTLDATKKFDLQVFGNYSRNRYNLVPQTRETNFGTIQDAKKFTVYFEGQEVDSYDTYSGSATATYKPKENLKLRLLTSTFHTSEEENFDILGQYFLDQLEADFGKENFGQVTFNLGVGSFLSHARNRLQATVYNVEHKGEFIGNKTLYQWGLKAQHESFDDKINEWNYLDSAGFSIPSDRDTTNGNTPQILLNDVVNSKISNIANNTFSGYIQNTWQITDTTKIILTTGVRANYREMSNQLVISPRISVTYKPRWKKNLSLRAAFGFYYQPPFYRELRDFNGIIHTDVKAQQSVHYVLGSDYTFLALGREFKLTTEFFYKQLDDLIPYKVDNLRLRYYANNSSKGYAEGIDMRLFGEFVPGIESWASVSFLQTEEDISTDFYYQRLNAAGDTIDAGTYDQKAVDSFQVSPGYIPRPTDQRITFGLFFQDYLPKFPTYKMQLSLLFGTALPFSDPNKNSHNDVVYRSPTYRRVDVGFSKQIIGEEVKRPPHGKIFKHMASMSLTLEVFNLLQVSNVSSYIWITDITSGRRYAIPNYLTGRQINVRLNIRF